MRLHYSDTHEHVQVGDETVTPDGMYIKIIAIYDHSGAILIEVLSGGALFSVYRRGATADEIGADWRGKAPPLFGDRNYFSLRPASDFVASPATTGRLCTSQPEIQDLLPRARPNHPVQGFGAGFAALELRLMRDSSFIIPIDEADRQRLLDGLNLLISMDTLAGQPERDAEQAAIQNLAERLSKV